MAKRTPKLVKPKPKVIDVDPMQPAQLVRPEPNVIDVPSQDAESLLGETASGQRGGLLSRIGGGIGNFFSQIDADLINQVSDQIVSPVLEGYVADRGGDPRNLATYQGRKRREEAAVAAAEEEAKKRLQAQKVAADQLAATRKRLADNQDFLAQAKINQDIKERNELSDRQWQVAKTALDFDIARLTGNDEAQRELAFDVLRKKAGLDSSSGSSSAGITPSTGVSTYKGFYDSHLAQQQKHIDEVVQYNTLVGDSRPNLPVPVLDDNAAHQNALKDLQRTVGAVEGSLRSGTMTASPSTASTITRLKENLPNIESYYGTQQFPKIIEQVDSLLSSISDDVTPAPTAADIVGRSTHISPDGLQIYTVDPSTGALSVRDNRAAVGVAMTEPQLMNAELNNKKFEAEQEEAARNAPPQKTEREQQSEDLIKKEPQLGSFVKTVARLNREGLVDVGYRDWLSSTDLTQKDFDDALKNKLGTKTYQSLREKAFLDPVTGRSLYEDRIRDMTYDIYVSEKMRDLQRTVSPADVRRNLTKDEKDALLRRLVGTHVAGSQQRAEEQMNLLMEQGRDASEAYSLLEDELKPYVSVNSVQQYSEADPTTENANFETKLKQDLFVEWSNGVADSRNETIELERQEFLDHIREVRIRQLRENPDLVGKVAMKIVDVGTGTINSGSSVEPDLDQYGNFIMAYNPEVTDQVNMIAEELGADEDEVRALAKTTPEQNLVDTKDANAVESFKKYMKTSPVPELFKGERESQLNAMTTLVGMKEDSRLDQDTLDPVYKEAIVAFNVLRELVAEKSGVPKEDVGGAELSGLLDMRVLRVMSNSTAYGGGSRPYKAVIERTIQSMSNVFDGKRTYYGSLERKDKEKIASVLVDIPFRSNEREFEAAVDKLQPGTPYLDADGFLYRKGQRATEGIPTQKPKNFNRTLTPKDSDYVREQTQEP